MRCCMNKNNRGNDRKGEILNAAKSVFLKKGFSKTTMEDVIAETSLSKGGVYYYYKSTKEMIFDIFLEGHNHRINLIFEYMKRNNITIEDLADENIMAEMITDKILYDNPIMEIYAQFVVEAMYDEELHFTYEKLMNEGKKSFGNSDSNIFSGEIYSTDNEFDFMTNIINTFIVGANILKANKIFMENRNVIKEMIKVVIREFKGKKK